MAGATTKGCQYRQILLAFDEQKNQKVPETPFHMNVLLVDDHPLFRVGLRVLLTELSQSLTITDALSLEEVNDQQLQDADIILLDLTLGRMSAPDGFKKLKGRDVRGTVVIVSSNDDPELIRDCIDNGAAGFIPKSSEPAVLIGAMQLILAGGIYLPPEAYSGAEAPLDDDADESVTLLDTLTARQKKALQLASTGLPNKLIASEMAIAEGTVKLHLTAAYKTLKVRSRTEAIYKLSKAGITL